MASVLDSSHFQFFLWKKFRKELHSFVFLRTFAILNFPPVLSFPALLEMADSASDKEELDVISDESLILAGQEFRRRRGALAGYSPLMASSSVTTYWSQATSGVLLSDTRGSDLWTSSKPGKKEIWSTMTYGLSCGEGKVVKLFLLETSTEDRRRFVGPTFHQPQEANHFCFHNHLAWPGDRRALDLDAVRSQGLLKAWSNVWSAEVEACVRTSAESAERFVENFNVSGSNLYVRLPKTFVDQLITQTHSIDYPYEPRHATMGRGYFFPDQPPDDSDGTDMPDTPIYRRVFAFTKIFVTVPGQHDDVTKYAFVRSRIKGDQFFVAVTPDYGYDDVDELKTYFAEDPSPYPTFDFDAKWILADIIRTTPNMA